MCSAPYDNVVITGGTGFLGRALTAALPGAHSLGRQDVDLTDGDAVLAYFSQRRPEVVVHAAARVGGITANMAAPADFLLDNLRMDAHVCAALRVIQPRHFICILSTCMYPDRLPDSAYPMTEDLLEAGPPPPTNAAYATAKRALWHGARALHAQYHIPYTALVPANLYGPGDHYGVASSHFLAAAITKIETARTEGAARIEFFGTGRALRQYVYVDDVAQVVRACIEKGPAQQTLNIAPQGHRSIAALAGAVVQAAGFTGDVGFSGTGPDGQFRKDVSNERLRAALPAWSHIETSLNAGLAATLAWYRRNLSLHGRG